MSDEQKPLTVGELIALLKECDPKAIVVSTFGGGREYSASPIHDASASTYWPLLDCFQNTHYIKGSNVGNAFDGDDEEYAEDAQERKDNGIEGVPCVALDNMT